MKIEKCIVLILVMLFLGCTAEEGITSITSVSKEISEEFESSGIIPTPVEPQTSPTYTSFEYEVIYYEPYPLAFYNAFYEIESPDITLKIFNPMETPLTIRFTSEYQGVSYTSVTTKTVEPGESETINQTIQLKRDEISKIKTKTKLSLHYKIEYEDNGNWKIWDEQTVQIDAYPMDTMVWAIQDDEGDEIPLHDYIATFVTPKSDAVRELLAVAKEYHPERSLTGYHCGDCSDEEWVIYTAQQIKAIYDALQDYYGVRYVNTPTAFGKDVVQKVSLPRDSLRLSSINCIDGVVLFASAIEALGMKPYIVIVPGHAFVAWDVKGDGSLIDALETTMLGSASFEDAWDSGNEQLEQYWDELFDDDPWNGVIVDITEAREAGILPVDSEEFESSGIIPTPVAPQTSSTYTSFEYEVIYYEPYPLAFYNTFYQMNIPSITFEIFNPMDNPITVKLTSEYQGVSYPSITTKTVEPGRWEIIHQTIQLKRDEISKIKTKTKLSLLYKIEYEDNGDWKIWDEQTVQIDAYPMDTMVWAIKDENGNVIPLYGYIATFVTPKSDAVRELLAVAKEYHPERSLTGYHCGDCSDEEWVIYTAQQIKAIYDALQDYYGVRYVNTPTAFGKDVVQKVNLPKDSLRLSSANCIDGVVLFASAIEALGMKPYIIIVPGHAFVAWDVKGDGSLIDALETTMLGSASFEDAWKSGREQLEQYWDELFDDDPWNGVIVDITEAREAGILPVE